MHNHFMNDLSFPFVMDLYRVRIKAENRADITAIESLKQFYPELFTEEFQEFIEKTKLVVSYLDQKYDQKFSRIFDPEVQDEVTHNTH